MADIDYRSLDEILAERKALREAGDPGVLHADLYRQIMPEPEGRAAYDAYERQMLGE